jgi:hypothetical protein
MFDFGTFDHTLFDDPGAGGEPLAEGELRPFRYNNPDVFYTHVLVLPPRLYPPFYVNPDSFFTASVFAIPESAWWDATPRGGPGVNGEITLSNGNLTAIYTGGTYHDAARLANYPATGKVYFELFIEQIAEYSMVLGLALQNFSTSAEDGPTYITFAKSYGGTCVITNYGEATFGEQEVSGEDIVCIAYDSVNQLVWFRVNDGLWNFDETANPSTPLGGINVSSWATGTLWPLIYIGAERMGHGATANFSGGSVPFANAVPAGFGPLDPPPEPAFLFPAFFARRAALAIVTQT